MFEHLGYWPRIVVTGPQRSGTTIAATMIAADLDYRAVDEGEWGTYDELALRRLLCETRIVVQAPHPLRALCDHPPPATLIVCMIRPLAEIHASEHRIGWRERYGHEELLPFRAVEGDPATIKYAYWAAHRPACSDEVLYADLAAHRLWVDAQDRTGWHAKQTAPEPLCA